MTEAEQKVKATWEWVQVRLADPFEGIAQGKWTVRLFMLPFSQIGFDTEAEAWSAALAFTEQRLEEIRQLREEIAWIRQVSYAGDGDFARSWGHDERDNYARTIRHCRASRILSRIDSILAEKSAGIRPEAL